MKFNPRSLPPEAADASRGHDKHPLKEFALLTVGVGLISAGLYLVAVLLTEVLVANISPAREIKWFGSLAKSLPQPDHLPPELESKRATADRLLKQLLEQSELKGLPVQLIVWDTAQTNAVALPGHTIAVTKGLLSCLDEEPAMAFVLAHELGHFAGRDHLRGVGRQLGLRVVVALLFSGAGDMGFGANQAGDMALLVRSRKRETAADTYALNLVYKTFGKSTGATRLLELLESQDTPGWAYMFSSHPATAARIEGLRQQAAKLK